MQKCFILFLREWVEWIKQSGCDFQHWNNKLLYSNHQPCATSLAHFCYISNWSLCCLHAPSHACIVCMQIHRLSQQQEGSDRMSAPRCFQAYFNACNYRQGREGAEESKGEKKKKKKEKEGNVFLTHTAPSFCSVTRLRSAGPPFSQSWTRAKKALISCLDNQCSCFNSTHAFLTITHTEHRSTTLHARQCTVALIFKSAQTQSAETTQGWEEKQRARRK